jgi:hypothetical protein
MTTLQAVLVIGGMFATGYVAVSWIIGRFQRRSTTAVPPKPADASFDSLRRLDASEEEVRRLREREQRKYEEQLRKRDATWGKRPP